MPPIVVYDACVLYPNALRDFLIRLAVERVVYAKWSERILDEVFRNIIKNRTDLHPERLLKTRKNMCKAIPDCMVEDFEDLEPLISLRDVNDRHVVAAAIKSESEAIITFNLKDFPESEMKRYYLRAIHPDVFTLEIL